MPQTIREALQAASFQLDPDTYRLVQLPPRAITAAAGVIAEIGEAFCVLIVDTHEVTLVIPDEAANDFAERLPGFILGETYRLVTVDAVLQPDLIGFMGVLATALATAEVGVFPYAAYTRDHILVPSMQADKAVQTLQTLRETYLTTNG